MSDLELALVLEIPDGDGSTGADQVSAGRVDRDGGDAGLGAAPLASRARLLNRPLGELTVAGARVERVAERGTPRHVVDEHVGRGVTRRQLRVQCALGQAVEQNDARRRAQRHQVELGEFGLEAACFQLLLLAASATCRCL